MKDVHDALRGDTQQAVLGAVIMPNSTGQFPQAIPEYGIQLIREDPYDSQTYDDVQEYLESA